MVLSYPRLMFVFASRLCEDGFKLVEVCVVFPVTLQSLSRRILFRLSSFYCFDLLVSQMYSNH